MLKQRVFVLKHFIDLLPAFHGIFFAYFIYSFSEILYYTVVYIKPLYIPKFNNSYKVVAKFGVRGLMYHVPHFPTV